MRTLQQIFALINFNLRTLPARKGSAAAAIVGIAGVVAVFVGVLSISEGFQHTMSGASSPDTVFVMRTGADSEMASILSRDEARILAEAPGVAKDAAGKPLVSPELFVVVGLPKKSTGTDANVPMRGVEQAAFSVRNQVKLIEGRTFTPGTNEVIAGRSAATQFSGLTVGNDLVLGRNHWKVVGIFESGGSISESEIWADASVLATIYHRGSSYQNAVVKLSSPGNFKTFSDAVSTDPRVSVKIVREADYYAEQSKTLVNLVNVLAGIITTLMGLAAIFGALNTMYTAVASRAREIATLEAIGFRGFPILVSVLFESIVLALIGGAVGALGALLAFDGIRTATLNWQTFSQVAFAFDVTPSLLGRGIFWASVIGLIGGIFPAVRAARLPVSVALRER